MNIEVNKKKTTKKIEKHELKGAYLGSSNFFCYVCSSCILITKENKEKNILNHVKSENHKISSFPDREEANFLRNQKIYLFLRNIFFTSNPDLINIKLEESGQVMSGMSKIEVNYETETESTESPIEISESTYALYKNSDSFHGFQTVLYENAELHEKICELEVLNSAKDLKIKSLLKRIKLLEENNSDNQSVHNIEQKRLVQKLEEAKLATKLESSQMVKQNEPSPSKIIQPFEATKKIKKKHSSLQKALDGLEKGYRINERMFNTYVSFIGQKQMDAKICILNSFYLKAEKDEESSFEIINQLWNGKFKDNHTTVFIPIICNNKLWHLVQIDLVKNIIKIKTYEQNFINLEIEKIIEKIDFLKNQNTDYKFKYYIFNWMSQKMEDYGIFLLKYLEKKCLGALSTLRKNDPFKIRKKIYKNIRNYLKTFFIEENKV